MRILLINPNISDSVSELIRAAALRGASPGTEDRSRRFIWRRETKFDSASPAWDSNNWTCMRGMRS